jgi:hypothetical protein
MFEDLEVPEQAYYHQSRIAIFHYEEKKYSAKIIDEFFKFDEPFVVKDMKLIIPRSHITQIGEDYFTRFLASAFKLMSKRNCQHPLEVLNPLRKKLRRIKRKLLRINPNNSALVWYLNNLQEMIKDMWTAARNHCLRKMTNQRIFRQDNGILNASLIY